MAVVLTLNEMVDALTDLNHRRAASYAAMLETLGTQMVDDLAFALCIKTSGARTEPVAFAGTCANFYAAYEGQPRPEALLHLDPDGEWEIQK